MHFDWTGELHKLRLAQNVKAEPRVVKPKKIETPVVNVVKIDVQETFPTIDVDSMASCINCGICVWIGTADKVPPATQLACPLDSDWNTNAEPFCAQCWDKERAQLEELGSTYKSIGPKVAKENKNKVEAAADKKKAAAKMKKAASKMKYKVRICSYFLQRCF